MCLYRILISMKFLVTVTNILHFGNHICFFHIYDHLEIHCLVDIFVFPYLYHYLLKTVHMCRYAHVHVYEVLSDSHEYFTFNSHTCSFTYTYIHTWWTYICMQAYIHECVLCMQKKMHKSVCIINNALLRLNSNLTVINAIYMLNEKLKLTDQH